MTRLLRIVGLLFLTSCTRENIQTYTFHLPEVERMEELEQIEATLWQEQNLLPEDVRFYQDIQVNLEPVPTLTVTVDRRQLGKQNLVNRLYRWGYSVDGREGDPVARAAFLAGAD